MQKESLTYFNANSDVQFLQGLVMVFKVSINAFSKSMVIDSQLKSFELFIFNFYVGTVGFEPTFLPL